MHAHGSVRVIITLITFWHFKERALLKVASVYGSIIATRPSLQTMELETVEVTPAKLDRAERRIHLDACMAAIIWKSQDLRWFIQ